MKKNGLTPRELCVFAMLGAILFLSKLLFEWAPNIHPLAALIVSYTVVYRAKAIIPVLVYLMLQGAFAGFNVWWVPYLYLWPLLWALALLLPKTLTGWRGTLLCMLLCGAHGLLFGTLYAPAYAVIFRLSLQGTLSWIVAGLPFDALHACGNLAAGTLVLPIVKLLRQIENKAK